LLYPEVTHNLGVIFTAAAATLNITPVGAIKYNTWAELWLVTYLNKMNKQYLSSILT